jgi:hypothetical protein
MINKIITIAAGIVFFDEEKGLQRCLNSIRSYIDVIIAIDGKFKYFEDDHDISMDNSREVVESFPNAAYYCYPNLTEIDKRNKYLEIAGSRNIDFLLVIDSDEYAVIDKTKFSKNLDKIKEYKTSPNGDGDGKTMKDKPDVYGIKIFEKHFEKPDYIREYRNFTSTDMTAANIYQFLGSGEEGQGILCEDEADRIYEDRQKMGIYKNRNITGRPVASTDASFGRKQLKLNTFCFKAFVA